MKKNKGFSKITIILIIVAVLVIGGIVYYSKFSNLKVQSQLGAAITSLNANVSVACVSTTTPWIKIIAPNGGETYTAGQQITVKWSGCNLTTTEGGYFHLMRKVNGQLISVPEAGSNGNLFSGINNSLSYTIPLSVPTSSDYVIHIVASSNNGNLVRVDDSDNTFTINNTKTSSTSTSSSTLKVVSPIPSTTTDSTTTTTTNRLIAPDEIGGTSTTTTTSTTNRLMAPDEISDTTTPIPTSTTLPMTICDPDCPTLGAVGTNVSTLQKVLIDLGYYNGIADGKFGPTTKAALVKWQLAHSLVGDGILGPKTWGLLRESPTLPSKTSTTTTTTTTTTPVATPTTTLVSTTKERTGTCAYLPSCVYGNFGLAISDLQTNLVAKRFLLGTPDGKFGLATKTAVENFQKENVLTVDGKVGPITYAKLIKLEDPQNPSLKIVAPTEETGTTTTTSVVAPSCGFIYKNPVFTTQTINPNTINNQIASYVIVNNCNISINVTNLHIGILSNSLSMPISKLNNLKVTDVNNNTLGNVISVPTLSNNYSVNFSIPNGSIKEIKVFANVGSAISGTTVQTGFRYNAPGAGILTLGPNLTVQ